jgi:hypothetical protein
MNKARLIITAINVEKISQDEAARRYGVSQSWVSVGILNSWGNWCGGLLIWRRCALIWRRSGIR